MTTTAAASANAQLFQRSSAKRVNDTGDIWFICVMLNGRRYSK
jgi:hypothetical protein